MLDLSHLLVAVDFSGASDAALHRACDLADRTGATLHVLHVVPGFEPVPADRIESLSEADRDFFQRVWDRADGELLGYLRDENVAGREMKRVLSYGTPAEVVLDYAAAQDIDLVVMGTHGRRGLRRLFLGSVAEEVLRRSDTPVMIVPESESPARPFRSVLAPTDFSMGAKWTVPVAAEVAALYGADLDIVHVLAPLHYAEALTGAAIGTDLFKVIRDAAAQQLDEQASDPLLERLVAGGRDEGAPVEGGGAVMARIQQHLLDGRPAEAIVEHARVHGADLVVMAKHGRDRVERLLLGSVTERVCRLAPCPVLVLPVDEHDDTV